MREVASHRFTREVIERRTALPQPAHRIEKRAYSPADGRVRCQQVVPVGD